MQAARETRQAQSKNNLKQLALGCLEPPSTCSTSCPPVAGPGTGLATPTRVSQNAARRLAAQHPAVHRAAGTARPGIEQQPGRPHRDGPDPAERYELSRRAAPPGCTPTCHSPNPFNLDNTAVLQFGLAGSELAGNSGSVVNPEDCWPTPPSSFTKGKDPYSDAGWMLTTPTTPGAAGSSIRHSGLPDRSEITDGTTNTFLCGEKTIDPDYYVTGQDGGDDRAGRWVGTMTFNRYTYYPANAPSFGAPTPLCDTPGYLNFLVFGSAHINGFAMAMCNSRCATSLNYSINPGTAAAWATAPTGCRSTRELFKFCGNR